MTCKQNEVETDFGKTCEGGQRGWLWEVESYR